MLLVSYYWAKHNNQVYPGFRFDPWKKKIQLRQEKKPFQWYSPIPMNFCHLNVDKSQYHVTFRKVLSLFRTFFYSSLGLIVPLVVWYIPKDEQIVWKVLNVSHIEATFFIWIFILLKILFDIRLFPRWTYKNLELFFIIYDR